MPVDSTCHYLQTDPNFRGVNMWILESMKYGIIIASIYG